MINCKNSVSFGAKYLIKFKDPANQVVEKVEKLPDSETPESMEYTKSEKILGHLLHSNINPIPEEYRDFYMSRNADENSVAIVTGSDMQKRKSSKSENNYEYFKANSEGIITYEVDSNNLKNELEVAWGNDSEGKTELQLNYIGKKP